MRFNLVVFMQFSAIFSKSFLKCMSSFMLNPSFIGISSFKSLQLGQADCSRCRALNGSFLTALLSRSSLCQAALVLRVTLPSALEAQGPCSTCWYITLCLHLHWNSSIRYLNDHLGVFISHRILNSLFNTFFHEEGLHTSFNTTWIPLRIAVMPSNVCLITCYKDSSCWFRATERRHISTENIFPIAICSAKCFRNSYGAWVYLCKPHIFNTECFLFRNE